jgi:recombinational DNA repair protein RecR
MNPFEKLIRKFEKFPGIGARQARRFVFHILTMEQSEVTELSELISTLRTNVTTSPQCYRFHSIPLLCYLNQQ